MRRILVKSPENGMEVMTTFVCRGKRFLFVMKTHKHCVVCAAFDRDENFLILCALFVVVRGE